MARDTRKWIFHLQVTGVGADKPHFYGRGRAIQCDGRCLQCTRKMREARIQTNSPGRADQLFCNGGNRQSLLRTRSGRAGGYNVISNFPLTVTAPDDLQLVSLINSDLCQQLPVGSAPELGGPAGANNKYQFARIFLHMGKILVDAKVKRQGQLIVKDAGEQLPGSFYGVLLFADGVRIRIKAAGDGFTRSEERRVGKECRSGWGW